MTDFTKADCARPEFRSKDFDWHPELENYIEEENARGVCDGCPIKKMCAQHALDTREAWGIWGGMEEFRMRRALGVDSFNNDRVYNRELVCPFCGSDDLNKAKKKGANGYPVSCNNCDIHWESFRIPDKVRKTLRRQYDGNVARGVERARNGGKPRKT